MNPNDIQFKLLKSSLCPEGSFMKTDEVLEWMNHKSSTTHVSVTQTCFSDLKEWSYQSESKNLCHRSGKFFSIDGIEVETNWGAVSRWQQPIINQAEIGILGILCAEFNGTLHFLLQAKIEPGNVNFVQLSPTLQATKSNIDQVHEGRKPHYLDYFTNRNRSIPIIDQLQSEQGSRFLKKRNRNILALVDTPIEVKDDFVWLTLGQIKKLLHYPNVINMDTRTVISAINFSDINLSPDRLDLLNELLGATKIPLVLSSFLSSSESMHSYDSIISWMTNLKFHYSLNVRKVSLKDLNFWNYRNEGISHTEDRYFEVMAASIKIDGREVKEWDQPLIKPKQEGVIGFLAKVIRGTLHFLIQAKVECGNLDIIELAPTVQCMNDDYKNHRVEAPPFLDDLLTSKRVIYETYQSEEGGRFYQEQNLNKIVLVENDFPETEIPKNYKWMTLNQIATFLKFNNYINIQCRSLLSALNFSRLSNEEI